jgi:GPH family glycoside/pentoside/hexuronide:cation symporter
MSDPSTGIIRPATPPAPATAAKPAFTAGAATIHAWGLGAVADYWMYSILGQLAFPLTVTFGVDPRVLGWAQALPRLVTAIFDPFIGHASDITHTRWGRRRPWMVAAAVLGAFLSVAAWWISPGWPTWAQYLFLIPMFTLLFAVWDIYDMAHTAMGYELSDDYCQRSKVVAIRSLWFAVAAFGGGFFYLAALTLKNGYDRPEGTCSLLGLFNFYLPQIHIPALFPGNEIASLRFLACLVGVIILIFGLIPVFAFKERFTEANRRRVSIWRAIPATFKNRPFVLLVLMQAMGILGSMTASLVGMLMYYEVLGKDGNFQRTGTLGAMAGTLGLLIAIGGGIVMLFLAAPLTRLVGKRVALMVSYGLTALASMVLPFFMVRGHPELILLQGLIFSLPHIIIGPLEGSVMPDICDLDELHSGERREALYMGVNGFINKILISLCILVGTYALAFAGCDTKLPTQPEEVLTRMRWLAFAPPIVFSILAFVISCFYPLTGKFMAEVRLRLDERRAAVAGIVTENGPTVLSLRDQPGDKK